MYCNEFLNIYYYYYSTCEDIPIERGSESEWEDNNGDEMDRSAEPLPNI